MKFVDLGPGSVPRKIAAMICLAFCALAIPIMLFRMVMGATSLGAGSVIVAILSVLCIALISVLRPKTPDA